MEFRHGPAISSLPVEELTIRLCKAPDAPILARHRCAMFLEMGTLSEEARSDLESASIRYFEAAIPAGDYVSWVVCNGDSVIAGGGMQINRILPRPGPDGGMMRQGPQGLILNVFVEKEWRRQGVAKRLMAHIIEFSRNAGIPRLVLHASDAGRPLYESLGFLPTSEMRLFL